MQKIECLKLLADTILNSDNAVIGPDELESLLASANSQNEKDLYIELYNFFLRKKSEEVIKNGKF